MPFNDGITRLGCAELGGLAEDSVDRLQGRIVINGPTIEGLNPDGLQAFTQANQPSSGDGED
ncbi:MAG: hypothetical protein VKI82_07125 [Leptolyngbya sp.]|nr:hypothetical protein [Leptolyngbya sp.]